MPEVTEQLKTALADRYVIERELGEGGMATVYLAHDVKHNRKVALKVLKPELAALIGAERFLKEIEVTANLQHPHILPLHDSGEADTFLYYVMPFVEGETLRDKMNREKQLGIEDAVEITRSVAGALDYAHRHDVIHRDIKPENILLHDGQAQVADFGIALAVSEAGGSRLTETGLSIGTPHYMSPEQAMGDRELDARSDIYSLAAMLYEMLSGDPPYTGSTAQAIVAKVITEKAPPVTTHRDTVPPHTAAAIQKALNKLPADRFTSAASFAEALVSPGALASIAVTAADVAAAPPARAFSTRQVGAVAAVAIVAIAAALWGWLRPSPAPMLARFAVATASDQPVTTNHNGSSVAIHPDGSSFVYTSSDQQLYVRELGQLRARPLPGTEGARAPFFSPDGEWVAFYSESSIKKVALSGGPPLTVVDGAGSMRGGNWGPDDMIVYAPQTGGGLYLVSAAGGEPTQLTAPDTATGETSHRWPVVLPNGKAVVFTAFGGTQEDAALSVFSFETGEITNLAVRGFGPRYAETGHLVYVTWDGALIALPFDPDRLEATGAPVSLLEGMLARTTLAPEFDISRNGSLVYLSGQTPDMSLTLVDHQGVGGTVAEDLRFPRAPRVSPDGGRVIVELQEGGNQDIWVYDLEQATMTRLTFEGNNRYPSWMPDGESFAFSSSREGASGREFFHKPADGSGVAELLHEGPGEQWEVSVMRGGGPMVIRQTSSGTTGRDIWIAPLGAGDSVRPFLVTEFNERGIAPSPDGRWLAYVSDESGQDEVYVRPVPGPGGKRQVSIDGGQEPAWSTDGRELYYRSGTYFMAADIQTRPAFSVGARRQLFPDSYEKNPDHTNYDIHPVTGQFLLVKGSDEPTDLVVVLNWFEELRERAGS
jgi:serine/threonine-protein kinase